MARVKYTTPNTRLTFEFDTQGIKQTLETIAEIQQVFEFEKCGMPDCGSSLIRYNLRTPKNAQGVPVKYYELVCQKCDARLDIHQHAPPAQTLYIPKTDKDKPNGGWYHYDGPQGGRQDHGGGYGNQQAAGPGGQQSRGQMSDDEKKFIDLLNTKGYTYAEGVGKIAQADNLNIGPNTPFAQIPRQNLIRFVTWLKSQPDAGSQTMDGADTGEIPF